VLYFVLKDVHFSFQQLYIVGVYKYMKINELSFPFEKKNSNV